MGGGVTIGLLIIDFGDRSEGNLESVGVLEALDDSPGPEVQTLLVEGHHTELLRREVVVPRVVGSLLVSYLR